MQAAGYNTDSSTRTAGISARLAAATVRTKLNISQSSTAMTIEQSEAMLTPARLATLLAVSPKSVYAWVKAGTIPACLFGSSIRFDPAITADWVRNRIQ
jgi:excisionase family DNA binding protein